MTGEARAWDRRRAILRVAADRISKSNVGAASVRRIAERIYADIQNFTDLTPTRSWSEVVPA